jgi:hypothetical protein
MDNVSSTTKQPPKEFKKINNPHLKAHQRVKEKEHNGEESTAKMEVYLFIY